MKMTMHIDNAVLADVMALTGAQSKTAAVELALNDLARRYRQKKLFNTPIRLTPAEWEAENAPKASDLLDAPDIDEVAVQRFFAKHSAAREAVAEDQAPYGKGPGLDEPER